MPVVGLTAYYTYGQVTALVRALLNDVAIAAGDVYTDAILLPHANAAYRKVQRALATAGSPIFLTDDVELVVAAVATPDPSTQVAITDATAAPNQLPTDLLEPLKLWERPEGSTDAFVEMADLTAHGGLPSQSQGTTLRFWEWREDGIYFIGATQGVQIRLRYQKALPDLVDANSAIFIRHATEPIAYFTAAMAAASRGASATQLWSQAGDDALEDLIQRSVRQQQRTGRRRRPFSARQPFT